MGGRDSEMGSRDGVRDGEIGGREGEMVIWVIWEKRGKVGRESTPGSQPFMLPALFFVLSLQPPHLTLILACCSVYPPYAITSC